MDEHEEIKELLVENNRIATENQKLLKKLHKASMIGLYVRILWYALLIGLPFLLYFYVLEPYFALFGSSFEEFQQGIGEVPGLKGFRVLFGAEVDGE